MRGGRQRDLRSLIIHQSSLDLFTWRQKGSKRERGSLQGLLKSQLRADPVSFMPHPVSQNKSQGQSRFQKQRSIFRLLMGREAVLHCKGSGYRQEQSLGPLLPFATLLKIGTTPNNRSLNSASFPAA